MASPCRYQVMLEPVDPLLFGDNRSARAGLDHMRGDQDVAPVTIHGAIGQFLADRSAGWPSETLGRRVPDILAADPQEVASLLGFAYRQGERGWFPKPRHLRVERLSGGRFCTLELLGPRSEEGWAGSSPGGLLVGQAEHQDTKEYEDDVLVDRQLLQSLLLGTAGPSIDEHTTTPEKLFEREIRPGIAVDDVSGQVEEGMLFTRPYRRFRPAVAGEPGGCLADGFLAWLETPGPVAGDAEAIAGVGFLGGDRGRVKIRLARLEEAPLSSVCRAVAAAAEGEDSEGCLLYLLTPMAYTGELPRLWGQEAVAAAIGRPRFTSGWDRAAGQPRPLEALIPSGSVFFYRWPGGVSRGELIEQMWLAAPARHGAAAGFGRVLPGVWR